MSAHRQPLRHRSTRIWQVLFCLTVLSFLCRAVIPMGYMPDLSGGRDGKFSITFCTMGGGISTLLVDLDGQPNQPSPADHFDKQDCPFGMVASQALIPGQDAPALVGVITHHPVSLSHRNQAQPPLPALGPPLGSRAPPSNLG
ncbi:DUF2946 family protein [Castellaniella hirudinis]|uniref:DUF2946 family protein n=1 Tax=Castellaniella hirudinis TaxID=1144617 RepID=A0ABV8RXW6_9BURK